jgi:putative copper export protein
MLSPTAESVRLFLHVLAASVWVGGQITLAGIVPSVRRAAPTATKVVAQAFARVAWPAFGVTVLTGMWAMMAEDITSQSSAFQATLLLKVAIAIASGVFAAVHTVGKSKAALAIGGALGALCAVVAMFLGVVLSTAG